MNHLVERHIQAILQHYQRTRGAGHTSAMLNPQPDAPEPFVLAVDHNHAKNLSDASDRPFIPVTLAEFPMRSVGTTNPLLIDNYTICALLGSALDAIHMERRRADAGEQLATTIQKALHAYQRPQ